MNNSSRLEQVLKRESLFSKEFNRVSYPTERFELRGEAAKYLVEKGFTSNPLPVEDLHLRVGREDQVPTDSPSSAVTTQIEQSLPSLQRMSVNRKVFPRGDR